MAQGEAFWAQVYSFAQELEKKAAEGVIAVVEIETYYERKLTPVVVQRDPPWLICQSAQPDEKLVSEIVFIREDDIRRVEIRSEHSGEKAVGFSVGKINPE